MQNEINLDYADFETILSHQGKVEGFVSGCRASEFMSSLSENLKLSLQNAKGVLIEFEQHSDAPLPIISLLLEEFHDLIGEDADVIFGTKQNDALEKDTIQFKMIASGGIDTIKSNYEYSQR
ncbi:MAG: hypothetical protein EOM50_13525 [Erysipelotrichia bacterium]|nr:hypothetical protein [Erysipelotrichia bacterium]